MRNSVVKKIDKKNIMIVAAVIAMLLIGTSLAYFSDRETLTKQFVVGDVNVEIEEPGWDESAAENIIPKQSITKDPRINNVGSNDAYVFLSVKIPKAEVMTAENDGTPIAASDHELFTYQANSGWTLIKTNRNTNDVEYVYAYVNNEGKMKVLSPNNSTNSLFDSVRFINLVEGQLDNSNLDIVLTAAAIQVTDFGTDDPARIYNIILKQSGDA